ncbi:MAG: sensor histidine kinase [Saprospirales bacterium]|nr:MAG: sensor histidine kinase [Saprospirales bacterium]
MKIRNRILLSYSIAINLITGVTLIMIYLLFAEYREEQFLKQQRERIKTTLQLFSEITREDNNIQQTMDILTVYDYYDEKLMIFNSERQLLYVSKEDIPSPDVEEIFLHLSPGNPVFKTREGNFEVVGIFFQSRTDEFYAISKAYDELGFTKMQFLRNILMGIFFIIAVIVVVISHFLSKVISRPITELTKTLQNYDLQKEDTELIKADTKTTEILELTDKFNQMLERTRKAFDFQKHTVHHISHQLKTPISVLVSELERLSDRAADTELEIELNDLIVKTKSLGSIINVLLEISKLESGREIVEKSIRIDELIFDIIDELSIVSPKFKFEVNFIPEEFEEDRLLLKANPVLMRQALLNLLNNCIIYSDHPKAEVTIDCSSRQGLNIQIKNSGDPIKIEEEKLLFNHFFRGENSREVSGFGLGLVLTKKILELHKAGITYSNPNDKLNVFEIVFD